ncbi:Na(+)/H(+) antiporter subunit C [Paenibacillus sp. SYP-B4298]|uniref:Na(+)/H(+) antiporter subunit C n=1 Tax=Paenibacillus sp. SYP-B4298 TaxID=2996034 RepID=UPI0022DD0F72|nr:Na(+)/H(+) antiporter subunit C [Paenibacillus sp. SYP-B4298]
MELLMALVIGVLFAVAVYLMLSRTLLRIIIGTVILSHGVHLLLMTMSRLKRGAAPIMEEGNLAYTDPLPQALILTSIVISFGVTAFMLVLAYRAYQSLGTDQMDELKGEKEHE